MSSRRFNLLLLGVIVLALIGVAYLAVPDFFLLAHGAFAEQKEFSPIRNLTVVLLRFVTAYCRK